MSVIAETEWTRMLPTVDDVFYGRPVAAYIEGEGFIVAGHDRRAYAAVNRMCPEQGAYRSGFGRNVPIRPLWLLIHETCGCTPEQHAGHVGGECYEHCVEIRHGLPPCGDYYAWMVERATPETPGAVPVLEVTW